MNALQISHFMLWATEPNLRFYVVVAIHPDHFAPLLEGSRFERLADVLPLVVHREKNRETTRAFPFRPHFDRPVPHPAASGLQYRHEAAVDRRLRVPVRPGLGTVTLPSPVQPVAAARAPATLGRVRWGICALLFFATTINYVDRSVLGILAPTLRSEIGWTDGDYGRISAAFTLAYAIGFLFAGWFIDRFGTRLEHRMTRSEITTMMEAAGLRDIRFSDGLPYWCAVGHKI